MNPLSEHVIHNSFTCRSNLSEPQESAQSNLILRSYTKNKKLSSRLWNDSTLTDATTQKNKKQKSKKEQACLPQAFLQVLFHLQWLQELIQD